MDKLNKIFQSKITKFILWSLFWIGSAFIVNFFIVLLWFSLNYSEWKGHFFWLRVLIIIFFILYEGILLRIIFNKFSKKGMVVLNFFVLV